MFRLGLQKIVFTQPGPKAAIESDEVEAVPADVDPDRRHLICHFAESWFLLLLFTAPKIPGCVSEHGRSIPLAEVSV